MLKIKRRGLYFLAALFTIGLILIVYISNIADPSLKKLNATFHTRISAKADLVFSIKKSPSFHGDGVSFYVYQLNADDMVQLDRDLSTLSAYSRNSKIGNVATSDLKNANQKADSPYALGELNQLTFYYRDRSRQIYEEYISNYDALLVDKAGSRIIYVISDS